MKKRYKIMLFIIIVLLILTGVFIYTMKHIDKEKKKIEVKILDTISEYGYTISDRDSEFYKNEFEVLKSILNEDPIDQKKYAEQVARMYVIDLFSMETKLQKTDVGGIEFVLQDDKENYSNDVENSYYDLLQDDSYGDRKQELPLVKSIETKNVLETTYVTKEGKQVDALEIELAWEYEEDLGDIKSGYVTVIQDGIYQSVVAFKETKEEEDLDY